MSAPQQGDPSSTAFDLFDRWMTNREAPAKAPEATPPALDDIVIADTKASREAARARLEAARLEQEGPESTPTTESLAPVLTPVDATPPPAPVAAVETVPPIEEPRVHAAPLETLTVEAVTPEAAPAEAATPTLEPTTESPMVDALVVQPAAEPAVPTEVRDTLGVDQASVVEASVAEPAPAGPAAVEPAPSEQSWGVGAEMPPFELPAYRPPRTAAVASEEASPASPAAPAPSGGKRRAAVATDSAPVIAAPSEGRRRRQVEPDAAPLVAANAAAETSTPTAAVIEPVETPTAVEPVAEAAPSVTTPPERSWAETLAALAQTETAAKEDPTPTRAESDELWSAGWGSTEDAASKQETRESDTDAVESTEESDDDARKGLNLKLILNVLAIVAVLGAGAAGYFLFKGSDWALRPTAGLTALGTFLVSARFTA